MQTQELVSHYISATVTSKLVAGKIRGLHGHRWLVVACDTKLLMHDLSSNLSREVARTALDGKAPTSVAFLYLNNPALLGRTMLLPTLVRLIAQSAYNVFVPRVDPASRLPGI